MSVRAKFVVQSVTAHVGWSGKTVRLAPQYDTTIPEDRSYAKATPSGSIELSIDNPPALEQFKEGQAFYVDFSKVG